MQVCIQQPLGSGLPLVRKIGSYSSQKAGTGFDPSENIRSGPFWKKKPFKHFIFILLDFNTDFDFYLFLLRFGSISGDQDTGLQSRSGLGKGFQSVSKFDISEKPDQELWLPQ